MPMLRFVLGHVGEGSGPARRLTMIGRFLAGGPERATSSMLGHCQVTGDIADRLGLAGEVGGALQQAFERWDGKGVPGHRSGEQLDPAMRVVQIADYADLKSPCWAGHSAGVAALAAGAAGRLGLPASEVTRVERAALVHDLGGSACPPESGTSLPRCQPPTGSGCVLTRT